MEGTESVAGEISDLGRRAHVLEVDVTKPEQISRMVERAASELARIDILVNNAGLALVSGKKKLWEVEDEEWRGEIDVN